MVTSLPCRPPAPLLHYGREALVIIRGHLVSGSDSKPGHFPYSEITHSAKCNSAPGKAALRNTKPILRSRGPGSPYRVWLLCHQEKHGAKSMHARSSPAWRWHIHLSGVHLWGLVSKTILTRREKGYPPGSPLAWEKSFCRKTINRHLCKLCFMPRVGNG